MNETQVIKALNALAQETRLRIVKHLVACGDAGASAGDIGDSVGASSSRLSFHLSALENAGVVSSERQSRNIIYRADYTQLGNVISHLLEDCCNNHPTVAACCLPGKSDDGCC